MTIGGIFTLLIAIFQFPAEITAFIKLLRATPDENRAAITAAIQAQLDAFQNTGRPS